MVSDSLLPIIITAKCSLGYVSDNNQTSCLGYHINDNLWYVNWLLWGVPQPFPVVTVTDSYLISSPWTPFGLSDDPFFQAALDPADSSRSTHPISLFVGRTAELRLIGSQVVGASSSRAILTGGPGVGKTSLVNRLKASLAGQGVLTHAAPVRVVSGMTPRHFEAEVLRVLLQMRAGEQAATSSIPHAPATSSRASEQAEDDAFWRRVGRLIMGEDSVAGGVSLGGFGVQSQAVRIPAEVQHTALTTEVTEAFRRLSRNGTRRLLLHVNNLENLSTTAAQAAANLMQQVRDTLLADFAHWVFVGATGIERTVFGGSTQVSSIIPLTVHLPPLAPADVADLLRRRYAHLRSGLRFTPPVDPQVAAALYERFRGDLRGFLNLLALAVQQHAISAPGRTVSAGDIIAHVAARYQASVVPHRLSAEDFTHLVRVVGGQPWPTEFRVTDVAARAAGALTQAGASKAVKRLLLSGVIAEHRRDGRSVYYQVADGAVSVALAQT